MHTDHPFADELARLPADPHHPVGLPTGLAELLPTQSRATRSPGLTRLPGVWGTYRLVALSALSGWSLRWSLVLAEARVRGIDPTSGAFGRSAAQLEAAGLWQTRVVQTVGAYALVRLTDQGKDLLHSLNIESVEGEWERMDRLHRGGSEDQLKHTAAVCAFAHHARVRGYETKVAPAVSDPTAEPDIALCNGEETIYVEVQRRGGHAWRRATKWWNLMRLQGTVALCAMTPTAAIRFRNEIQRCGIDSYCITDLQTLHRQAPERLWTVEQTKRGTENRA